MTIYTNGKGRMKLNGSSKRADLRSDKNKQKLVTRFFKDELNSHILT
jgi:hypothetical protein